MTPMALVDAFNVVMERKAAATGQRLDDLEPGTPDGTATAPVVVGNEVVARMVGDLDVDVDELRETVAVLLAVVADRLSTDEEPVHIIDDVVETALVIGLVKGRHDAREEARAHG